MPAVIARLTASNAAVSYENCIANECIECIECIVADRLLKILPFGLICIAWIVKDVLDVHSVECWLSLSRYDRLEILLLVSLDND